ncbi:MAG: nucleotidyltransferase family protein [Sneathiella sp.]
MSQSHSPLQILLLAAGQSVRMGAENKLLMPYGRKTMVRHIAEQLVKAKIGDVTVVTGYDARSVTDQVSNLKIKVCFNPDYEAGQMSSVRTGIQSLPLPLSGTMIVLADMPALGLRDYRFLAAQFQRQSCKKILIPYYAEKRGNPIIIPGSLVPEICTGDLNAGCKKLVDSHPDKITKVAVTNSAFISDVDTASDYEQINRRTMLPHAICC